MINYTKGNLLESKAQALVNTVNTVGVMGKGIALQFKNRFPHNYAVYKKACKDKTFNTGQVLVVKEGDLYETKYIVNFPTKAHWKSDSVYEYISTGLVALKKAIVEHGIKSIAIPPLGCGNGGLDWIKVKALIEEALQDLDVEITIYEPNEQIKSILQKEETKTKAKLTPARAMLLYMLFHYESKGEQSSLFVANKLAYFLQRSGEKLRLKFEAHHYGPYAVQLNHVLYSLNGTYLKGLEQNEVKPFEAIHLSYDKWEEIEHYIQGNLSVIQKERLEGINKLIAQYESTFSLELLATVDYVSNEFNVKETKEVAAEINKWSKRKSEIFNKEQIGLAINHLKDYSMNGLKFS